MSIPIDPSIFTNLIVASFEEGKGTPTPEEVERRVDDLLVGPYATLASQRVGLINEVLRRLETRVGAASILDNQEGHEEWLSAAERSNWRHWPRLEEYLQAVKKMPRPVLRELDRSTDDALGRLESPDRTGRWDRRGLVLGHVQSGKTTHYTTLAAKALDAGYQIVIILAGIHNSLRSQTHERVDHQLIGRDSTCFIEAARNNTAGGSRQVGVGERDILLGRAATPNVITFTSSAENGDFSKGVAQQIGLDLGAGTRLVLVVKKNATILDNLIQWFESQMPRPSAGGEALRHAAPALVIDDEADHASINTNKDPEADPRRINGLIRRLLGLFDRVGFVGYTATPFANIFIATSVDHDTYGKDLFPEHFIINLKAPTDYVGPSLVFGHPGDDSVGIPAREPLPMFVEVSDAAGWMPDKHKQTHVPGTLPPSLKEAIRLFALVCAARCCGGDRDVHNSMLVHVTRFVNVQQRVYEQITEELDNLSLIVRNGSSRANAAAEAEMRTVWEQRVAACHAQFAGRFNASAPSLPAWDAIWQFVPRVLERIRTLKVNGTASDALVYSKNPKGLYVIAVGGDKLSRGLTLEGLSVSYFLRTSRMYDTLMQMGRWFGYKAGYVEFCRVYTPRYLLDAFREISLATEELRNDLDYMAAAGLKPCDFGLRIREPSDGLLITAPDKMRSSRPVAVKFAGELVQTLVLPRTGPDADNNRAAVRALIGGLGEPVRQVRGQATAHFLWHRVPVEQVLAFLANYEAHHTPSFCDRCNGLRKYVAQQVGKDELGEWTVALISREKGTAGREARIGSLQVPLILRKPSEALSAERFATQAVVGSADEAVDLTEVEYEMALTETRRNASNSGDIRPVKSPMREIVRQNRPVNRALLLIYPIADPERTGSDDFIPAIAASFPDKLTGGSAEYRVTEGWLRQHGLFDEWEDEQ